MESTSDYLVGVKTTGDVTKCVKLSNLDSNKLRLCLGDDDWIYKIIKMKNDDLKEYEELNNKCSIMDLFDKEFDSIIHRIRSIEITSVHLHDYMKNPES